MAVALAIAACSSGPGPSGSQSTSRIPSAVPSAPSAASPAAPSAAPSAASPALACPVTRQTGLLPSDRLVDLVISSTPTHDLLTFVFATGSSPSPAGLARGTLEAVAPPFTFAGSGLPIDLLGQHAVQLRFSAMTIASETGEATYRGPADVKPARPALREAIQYDASEGIIGWYVGYDGPGCVTLSREGDDVTVMIAHPEVPAS